jgi:hypothetical protein
MGCKENEGLVMHWVVVLLTVLGPIVSLSYVIYGPGKWYTNLLHVMAVWVILWLVFAAIVVVNHRSLG